MDQPRCSVGGDCSASPKLVNGMCTKHDQRLKRTGTTEARTPAPGRCTVADCNQPNKARGLCGTHYSRWRTHGDPLIVGRRGHARTEDAEAARRRKIADTSRGRKLGPRSDETRAKLSAALTGRVMPEDQRERLTASLRAKREQIAETSRAQWEQWRAERGLEKPGYYGLHRRVRTARGPAKNYECIECGHQAQHWATIHGTDGTDPLEHYLPMCARCHFAYDQVGARAVATKGPEGCRAIALKAWETKRRKSAAGRVDDPSSPALAGDPHRDD